MCSKQGDRPRAEPRTSQCAIRRGIKFVSRVPPCPIADMIPCRLPLFRPWPTSVFVLPLFTCSWSDISCLVNVLALQVRLSSEKYQDVGSSVLCVVHCLGYQPPSCLDGAQKGAQRHSPRTLINAHSPWLLVCFTCFPGLPCSSI